MSKNEETQTTEIQRTGIKSLISISSIFGFCWIMIFLLTLAVTKEFKNLLWVEGIVIAGISIIPIGYLFLRANYIQSALFYHLLSFISSNMPIQIICWLFISKIMNLIFVDNKINILNAVFLVTFIVYRSFIEFGLWESATVFLVETGRLDKKKAYWDLGKKIRRLPEHEVAKSKSRAKGLMYLTYLIPGIGMYLARKLAKDTSLLLISALMNIFLFIIANTTSQSIGLMLYLRKMEKDLGEKILLRRE